MRSEIELYFGGEDPHMTITPVETSCVTELATMAYAMQKDQKAEHVSFGPVIERDADGSPKTERRKA